MVDHDRDDERDEAPPSEGGEALPSNGDRPEGSDVEEPLESPPEDAPAFDPTARRALYAAVAALVVAVAALVLAWSSGGADRIETRTVAVVDDAGRTRAVLGTDGSGAVSLRLLDSSGRAAATLEAGAASPELNLQGREGQVRLGLGDVVQNGGGLSFYDAGDRLRVGLAFSPGVGSNLVLGDEGGNIGVQVALDPQGPFVTLRAPDGSVVWAVPEPAPGETGAGNGTPE